MTTRELFPALPADTTSSSGEVEARATFSPGQLPLLRLPSHPSKAAAGLLSSAPSSAMSVANIVNRADVVAHANHKRWQGSLPSPELLFSRSVPVLMTGAGIICLWIETESFSAWPRLLAFGLLSVFCLLYLFGLWSKDRLTRIITIAMLVCALLVSLGFLYQSVTFMQQRQATTEYVVLQHGQVVIQGKQAGVRIGRIWLVRGAGQTVYYFQVVGEDITTYRLNNATLGAQLRVGQVVALSYQTEQSDSANSDIALITSLQVVSSH